jgi:hypothetical protein
MQQPINNNKQQTAVEWFNEEINKLNVGTDARVFIAKLFQQAKEMEKEQIKDACQQGFYDGLDIAKTKKSKFISAEHYYNETFNK